jgi:flagellar motor protein MotB
MSTPISTLPLKTQQTNVGDTNDINDPLVQDVLSEFQEELMMSKQPKPPQISQEQIIQQQQIMLQQQMQQQQMQQLQRQQQQQQQQQQMANTTHNTSKYDNILSYIDIEVAKKSLILVIVSLIIYNSGIINIIYEKLPDYLQDNLNNFDIYIKSVSLFLIIYVLSFFEYI